MVTKALSSLQPEMHISVGGSVHDLLQRPPKLHGEPVGASVPLAELLQRLKAEATEHGILVLPDSAGSGPMYLCLLLKS